MKKWLVLLLLIFAVFIIFEKARIIDTGTYHLVSEEGAPWQLNNGYIDRGLIKQEFGRGSHMYVGNKTITSKTYASKIYFLKKDGTGDPIYMENSRSTSNQAKTITKGYYDHSGSINGFDLPHNWLQYDLYTLHWDMTYKKNGVEHTDHMLLSLIPMEGKRNPIAIYQNLTKENLVSENSNPETDLLYLGQSLEDALSALKDNNIGFINSHVFDNEAADMYGYTAVTIGDVHDLSITYDADGHCFAISVFTLPTTKIAIGDSSRKAKRAHGDNFEVYDGEEGHGAWLYTMENHYFSISTVKPGWSTSEMYYWSVFLEPPF